MAAEVQVPNESPQGAFPIDKEFEAHLRGRQRAGRLWRNIFLGATLLGILILIVLLLDIINDAFGYVAIQPAVNGEELVVKYYKDKMLAMPKTLSSESDEQLAAGVAARPSAIGFFGYAFYKDNADTLKTVAVEGVQPELTTVETGQYPLARPLYVYSTQPIMTEKPQVAAFIYYYLNNANNVIGDVGYFPMSAEVVQAGLTTWQETTGLTPSTAENLLPAAGDILVTGSSTVAPLTQQLAADFQATGSYAGTIQVDSIGTDAGFQQFCVERQGELVDASIAMPPLFQSACQKSLRDPLAFRVGTDGIPIVVSVDNAFLSNLTNDQLRQIFLSAETWNQVDPSWPAEPIFRFIPGAESGTLDFFITSIFGSGLTEQPDAVKKELLLANVSRGRLAALAAETPLEQRTTAELDKLLEREILKPQVAASWSLYESIFDRQSIEAQAAAIPGAVLTFKSWINWNFITSPQSSDPLQAGIWIAILGSLWVTIIAAVVAVPLGVAAAIYLEEYSTGQSKFDQIVETNINNLAGVPSIIYGMLGLAVFVRFLAPITSGAAFGQTDEATANGRTILSAGLTLGVLVLPLIIINAREAIRAVPRSLREGAYGLGATKWQTTWHHVLPNALPGILTGVILSVSRAFGETAPLIVVGVSTFIVVQPDSVFSKYTTLPAQIYQWTSRPQEEFQHLAAAAILVLLVLLVAINGFAIWLRNRTSQKRV